MYWPADLSIDYFTRANCLGLWLFIFLLSIAVPAHSCGLNDELTVNARLIQGDWLHESDSKLGFIHINHDSSYSHVVIDLANPQSSFHHWGQVSISHQALVFRPSEIALATQTHATVEPKQVSNQTQSVFIDALLFQTIHYTSSDNTRWLTLSTTSHSSHENEILYQTFESHHTFGFWPDKQSIDMSYLVIFPSGYYAHIYSDLAQTTAAQFVFGQLF